MFEYHVNEFITNWSYQYTGRDPHLNQATFSSLNLYFKVLSIKRFYMCPVRESKREVFLH